VARLEDIGLIGNGQYAAHVAATGDVVWCCLPRFEQHQRAFHPTQLFRIVEPIRGTPRVQVRCEPVLGWSGRPADRVQGSNHVRFEGFPSQLRLTTDVPLSYLGGQPFTLTGRRHLVLTWDAPIEEPLPPLADRFLSETVRYWQRWVKHCEIPAAYQEQVIRSALTLKLHCFEDTGAIVAATTTSLPESPGSGRTWDYRYCWLRDAFFVLGALRRLGCFEERERFTQWLFDVAGGSADLDLAPLYRLDGRSDLAESQVEGWAGYQGSGPVRTGNGAASHRQNDVYGETALSLVPVFLDERFRDERSDAALDLVVRLARKAVQVAGTPDAGIWEYRGEWTPQTFSTLMSWAAADRVAMVLDRQAPGGGAELAADAARLHAEILERCWRPELGSFAASYRSNDLDASTLLMVPLRFLPHQDPRVTSTVDRVSTALGRGDWLDRYRHDDGFGTPQVAFVLCTFWLVQALAGLGRHDEARRRLEATFEALSPLGLLSEDYDPRARRLWGNFPQAYSHVGLIHAAFDASPRWPEVL